MRTVFRPVFYIVIIGILILSSCNLPTKNATAEPVKPTQAEASSAKVTATIELTATLTETPALTATETLTPEPSATNTQVPIMAKVNRVTNCRTGPAGNYDLVAQYQAGQMLQVVAKDLGNTYWFVQNPEKSEEQCYLLAQNVTISGDTSVLPQFTPQPSPTAAPDFKGSFKKFDKCGGDDFAQFIVENLSSVPFRSAYIKVTDLKINRSVDQAVNAFDLYVGCTLAKNVAPLNGGATGYLSSATMPWDARSHRLRAVLMLCTEKDWRGACVTKSIDIKP
ncbi:MAG TPA: hypothetical protein VHL11_18610 [Phototrophicaceae bacterium]|nr:hypothetical protein [Phototrophicaceae bacterium]